MFVLWRKYQAATGLAKLQIRYLLLAFSIPCALGMATNLFVPLVFKTSEFGKYGPLFTLLMLAIIAHAIIRHRLMDVRVVIKRGAVYVAAFVVAGGILVGLLFGSNALFHDEHQVPTREILLALTVAVLFHPLKAGIQRAFDRYLYREPYDYQRIVRESSRALTGTLDLSTLLDYLSGVLRKTLRPEGVSVYLLGAQEGDETELRQVFGDSQGRVPEAIPVSSPLVVRTARDRLPIFRDELEQAKAPDSRETVGEFVRLSAEVAVPLLEEDRVFGLLVLGRKRSGDPYFSDDADLLATLANQSAVAIRNAQTHQQVVQANEHIQRILATMESGVIAVGPSFRITLSNRAAEEMVGASPDTLRGRRLQDLPVPFARLIDKTIRDGQSHLQTEIVLPDSAGQPVPIVCSTSPLHGLHGSTVGAVAVFSDLSRIKELEAEKRRAERLASLEAIASGLVHEIRNPLVGLKTFTQLLPSRFHDIEFRDSFTRIADREIDRINGLLVRFRTLASSSSLPMEALDISVPLQATVELLRPQLEERRIELRQISDGAPRQILGNASQLEQLFHNLCINAIEAMEPGGELTVRVAEAADAGAGTLVVEISDTGSGISAEILDAIFNPFVSTKSRGSGLGLAICRAVADAHRATLRAQNNTGRPGCTFSVEFPFLTPRQANVSS
jgi:PAS domain S-box-containing protein